MKKLGVGLTFGILTMAAVTIGIGSGPMAQHFQNGRKPASISNATPEVPESTRLAPSLNEEHLYSFQRKLEARIQGEALLEVQYSGSLKISALKTQSGETRSVARLEFDPQTLEKFEPELRERARLESPAVAFVINKNGSLSEIKTLIAPKNASRLFEEKKNILVDLVAQYAFFSQTDTLGDYDALFTKIGSNRVRKEKTSYHPNRTEIRNRVISSQHEISWNIRGVETVIGQETIESGNESMRMLQTSSYVIREQAVRPSVAQDQALAQLNEADFESTTIAQAIIDRKPAGQKITRKTWAWNELLPRLQALSKISSSEKMKTFYELIRSLSKSPALVAKLEALLRANPKDEALFKLGVGALASVGGIAAERSLKRIYEASSAEPEKQRMILTAFTATDAPITSETQDFIKNIAIEPAPAPGFNESAAYALGASLKKEQDAVQRQDLEKTLIDLLAQSKTNYEKATYLDAIGNSGDPSFLPQVRDYLNSENTVLREKAVFSLRWMPITNVSTYLNQALDDPQAAVRRSAVQAIRYQKDAGQNIEAYQDKIGVCARQDASPELRRQCTKMQTGAET